MSTIEVEERSAAFGPDGTVTHTFVSHARARSRIEAARAAVDALARRWPKLWGDLDVATLQLAKRDGSIDFAPGFDQPQRARQVCAPELDPRRELWVLVSNLRPWTVVARVTTPREPATISLAPPLVHRTRHGDLVRCWLVPIATGNLGHAWMVALATLAAAHPELWGGLEQARFVPCGQHDPQGFWTSLRVAGLPRPARHRLARRPELAALRCTDRLVEVCEWRSLDLWPSDRLRVGFSLRASAEQVVVVAVCTEPARDLHHRSLLAQCDDQPLPRVGLSRLVELELRQMFWGFYEPGAIYRQGHDPLQRWLCQTAPGADLPEVPVELLDRQGADFYEPGRVRVARDVPELAAHRSALLAVAAERGELEDGYQLDRAEALRVSFRTFRRTYEPAAARPVYGVHERKSPWTSTWLPRPRRPAVVDRWSGLWNPAWRFGYEFWGCQVWTLEWWPDRASREILVVIDVQTD